MISRVEENDEGLGLVCQIRLLLRCRSGVDHKALFYIACYTFADLRVKLKRKSCADGRDVMICHMSDVARIGCET